MPATTTTIDRGQREGLYELVRNHLGSIEDFFVALERAKDFAKAEQLAVEVLVESGQRGSVEPCLKTKAAVRFLTAKVCGRPEQAREACSRSACRLCALRFASGAEIR